MEVNLRQVLRLVEHAVDQSHGVNFILHLLEHASDFRVIAVQGLQGQHGADHLHIIFGAMVKLPQQTLLLLQ